MLAICLLKSIKHYFTILLKCIFSGMHGITSSYLHFNDAKIIGSLQDSSCIFLDEGYMRMFMLKNSWIFCKMHMIGYYECLRRE